MGPRVRVAVVDDHQVFADALAERLAAEPDLEVQGTAASGAQAVALLDEQEVDVVTLDLVLGVEDGLDVARELAQRNPGLGMVVVTGADADVRCLEAVRIGVRGWVSKLEGTATLVDAVRGVARGETHLPPGLLSDVLTGLTVLADGAGSADEAVVARLSQRELDVLRCLVDGRSRREIGEILGVSPNTVRTHVQSILGKFGVHSALTAVAIARRAGVVRS
ncbi:response regulator transcription factor [Nocardioides guangzhouensis]|uniref:Response regulator transcription factor n=1 Tax=Nocardioides guangzhouensis TaxID=2497878 RepID=A0A4Q4ZHE7_9ACTN|nr:response regulator transcription factor [Nocardioides guangzhouensis]RYP87278.1 response regulator transcription factor [Nocardioides guangzhouensis]